MFCNLDELMILLLCYLHCSIEQFRNTLVANNFSRFHTTTFTPCIKMSGKGDASSASSVGHSQSGFQVMIYYDYCQGKSFKSAFKV